jgi:hypothetical protein
MQSSANKFLQGTIFALILSLAPVAFAQVNSASLTGQVVDPTGGAVAKAAVTAQNVATNLVQSTTTNEEGIYLISPLPPGPYTLTVEVPGFKKYVQAGIVLTVSLTTTQNVSLQIGKQAETITVEANAEMINTTSAELGAIVNQTTVTQLPLNGRDPSSLVFLAPGVTNVLNSNGALQAGFSFPTETGGSANGGRQGSTYYLLDGVPNMDNYLGLTAPFPNSDATQEFRVITNNFDANYGFAPGAVVSIQTMSGSNSFHGDAFEFHREQNFNATNAFSHLLDPLHRNQFGGGVGGPILKNKLFFFFNYQGTRSSSASTANFVYTPTAAMMAGDFSGICNPAPCTSETLSAPFGPANGKFNQINPDLYNSASVTIATTGLPAGQQSNGGVYYTGATTINKYNENTVRLDYDISDKQRVSLRSFMNYLTQPSGDVNGNILSVLNLNPWGMVMGETMKYYNEVLNHTWTINPTTVNNFSVFWTQMSAHNGAAVNDSNGKPMCFSRYINVTETGCYIEGFGVSNGFSTGWTEPSQEVRTTYGLYDTFSKTLGKHFLSFGVNLQHQFAEELTEYPTQPILSFGNSFTGNGLADFLLGDLQQYQQGAGEIADVAGWQPGFFAQDQYKVRPNLTLTLGLRWDPNLPPAIAGGRAAGFIPGEQSTVYPNAPTGLVFPGDKGVSDGIMPTTYGYWEPRLGVAWQPSFLSHTSIRAGFGSFTSPLMYSMYNHTADNAPFSPYFNFSAIDPNPTKGIVGVPIPFSDPWSVNTGTGGVSPFPPFASVSYKPPSTVAFSPGISIPATFSPDFHLGVTQSWNLSIEHEFGFNMLVRAAYVGSESYHLSTMIDQNPGIYANGGARTTYPDFGQILTDFSNGTSDYHAFQLTVDKRISHGLQFQSNFTWSKAIDDTSSGNISFGSNSLADPFNLAYNRGISDLNFPFIWVSNFVYSTPSLSNKDEAIKQTLGGWEVTAIVTLMSGNPFGISSGANNNSGSQQYLDRADFVSGQAINMGKGSPSDWVQQGAGVGYFNFAAFQDNAFGTFGDTSRNMFHGPHRNNTDMGIFKNFSLKERYVMQLRCEMFNAFNHVNYGNPGNTATWGNFGQITGYAGGAAPRVLQVGLKFTF